MEKYCNLINDITQKLSEKEINFGHIFMILIDLDKNIILNEDIEILLIMYNILNKYKNDLESIKKMALINVVLNYDNKIDNASLNVARLIIINYEKICKNFNNNTMKKLNI